MKNMKNLASAVFEIEMLLPLWVEDQMLKKCVALPADDSSKS
jgi:hypothetical protein